MRASHIVSILWSFASAVTGSNAVNDKGECKHKPWIDSRRLQGDVSTKKFVLVPTGVI
jgi:hypothetical protein